MFSFQKGRCSWSLVAAIASLLALISVVHLFLLPVIPSFEYFGARQAQTLCTPVNGSVNGGKVTITKSGSIDSNSLMNGLVEDNKQILQPVNNLTVQYPSDLRNAVVYHGAPWKAEIGRWLSGCDSTATAVKVVEQIGGKSCKNDCSGQGICNHELGQCHSFLAFTGEGCSERQQLSCNFPGSSDHRYGPLAESICSANCDTTRAMYFCGEGTKYPNRPVTKSCGFQISTPSGPGGHPSTDWSKVDMDIFTTTVLEEGGVMWILRKLILVRCDFKEECHCLYDGLWGRFCEIHVQSICINQCAGHGYCNGGFCQCDNGWLSRLQHSINFIIYYEMAPMASTSPGQYS